MTAISRRLAVLRLCPGRAPTRRHTVGNGLFVLFREPLVDGDGEEMVGHSPRGWKAFAVEGDTDLGNLVDRRGICDAQPQSLSLRTRIDSFSFGRRCSEQRQPQVRV